MRILYLSLLYLFFPFIWVRLKWRSRKAPAYAEHWGERLGNVSFDLTQPSIWIHSASLGETIAATPIIKFLQTQFPQTPLVLTAMTPTGRAKAQTMQSENVHVCYVPYDYPFAIKKFLRHAKPKLAIFIETELWPNILTLCGQQRIPFFLANARMSEKSKNGYLRIASLTHAMLQNVTCVAAQTQDDEKRLIELGLPNNRVHVTGSLKFDLSVPADLIEKAKILRQHYGASRPVFIAASTHEGEDKLILQSFMSLRQTFPDLLLLLVPRHPERFNTVAQLCEQTSLPVVRRSRGLPNDKTAIYVGDTLGELLLLYATADIAFVGGSFIPQGGHNPLEPAALGVPVLMGPHVFNFAEIVRLLTQAGGLIQVTPEELTAAITTWLRDTTARQEAGQRAKQVVENNRGALQRQLDLIEEMYNQS